MMPTGENKMGPNIEFEEGKRFAWKTSEGAPALLFMKMLDESFTNEHGDPAVRVTLEQMEEAFDGWENKKDGVFTFVFMGNGKVRYPTGEMVVMEGGDVLFF